MFSVTHFYNRPVHAIRIFERVLREQGALGRSLHALTHVCSLGTGIRLRFAFAESAPMVDHRVVYWLGWLREASAVADAGWQLDAVLPMRALWITIGHFYLLTQPHQDN